MALLSGTKSSRRARVPLLFMALSAAGCVLFSSKEDVAPQGLAFPHKVHIAEGLECADCHLRGKEGEKVVEPRRITYEACAECHDDEDKALPEAK